MLNKTIDFLIKAVFGVIFLLIVTPAGFLLRIVGFDFLERTIDPNASTYWKKHI